MLSKISNSFFPSMESFRSPLPSVSQMIKNIQRIAIPLILLGAATYTPKAEAGFGFFTVCMAACTAATGGALVPACVAACVASLAAPTP